MPQTATQNQPNKALLLAIIIITSVVNPFLGSAINIALPKISADLDLTAVQMSWIAMSFLLSSAVFLVPLGKIADIAGRKKIFVLGNILVAISSVCCAASSTGYWLIAFRVLQGFGSAMMFGTGMAIITSAFPPGERGAAIGINVTAVYIGLSVAPVLGGLLTDAFGWRSLFYITVPFGIAVGLITHFYVKTEWADAKGDKFDFIGSIMYMLAMSAFMYGLTRLPETIAIWLAVSGFIGILFFIYYESNTQFPVLNISLFSKNRVFAFSNMAALINYAATFAIGFILSLYLQYIKGLTPVGAGTILVAQPAVMALVASFSGRMSDKYPARILSSVGMAIIVAGLYLLSFLDETTQNSYLIICLIIVGVGFGLFSSPNTNSIMSSVERKYLGIASATVGTMRLTGQMFSMGFATLVIHIFIGNAKISPVNYPEFLKSLKLVFVLFAFLCLLGVFASLARGKKSQ